MVLALTHKAVASYSIGQPPFLLPLNNFAIYGRVLPVQRAGGGGGGGVVAILKTQSIVQIGGFYAEWGQNEVIVNMPDVTVKDADVKVADLTPPAAAPAVVLIVTAWRANASLVRGAMGAEGRAALDGALLGQYVSVSLMWHRLEGAQATVALLPLAVPVRLGFSSKVPNVTSHVLTGRQTKVAACVYLGSNARAWDLDGMSLALNSSSISNFSSLVSATASSAVAAGDIRQVVCEAHHLTSFTVRAEETGCDGIPRTPLVLDRCRKCGGNNECVDCSNVPFGNLSRDPCGICGGSRFVFCQNTL